MARSLRILILAGVALPACSIYGADLLEGDGVGTGGVSSIGGMPGVGGAPGAGGLPTGGTSGSGGSTGGSGSNGGAPPAELAVIVDDMEHVDSAAYDNGNAEHPFYGTWYRYDDASTDVAFDTPINKSFVPREDDAENLALHVKGTGLLAWGVDTNLTLNESGSVATAVDLSSFYGLRFWAKADSATTALRLTLADADSHPPDCETLPRDGTLCDKHAAALPAKTLTTAWKQYEVVLSTFKRGSIPVDLTSAFALHFNMDPGADGEVDFWIDDIEFFAEP